MSRLKVALTGGGGFLGWHTRAVLSEMSADAALIDVGAGFDESAMTRALTGADQVIHIAGVNRALDREVESGNLGFARQLAEVLRRSPQPPPEVVFANSTQAGNGTVYGSAKAGAAEVLAEAAAAVGAAFVDVRLPNLFGEHGRPFYNAVTATFCQLLVDGGAPEVEDDKELSLLHAQDAAELLIGVVPRDRQAGLELRETVSGLLGRLTEYHQTYQRGEIPDLGHAADRNLFNTYRSYMFPKHAPVRLTRHADDRGSFFEVIRSHGGSGQSSFSTTMPGISRGDHFHRRKVERFTVLAGTARISLRRIFTTEVVHFDVTGENPVAVDIPSMWAHRITNTGTGPLYTSFWTNDIFDPANPDTIAEVV